MNEKIPIDPTLLIRLSPTRCVVAVLEDLHFDELVEAVAQRVVELLRAEKS